MVLPTTDPGLSAPEAAQRLQQDGPNVLASEQRRTWRMILRETLREPMFMLLLAAGTLYLTLGDLQEGLVMFALVLVVLSLTLYQEGRTEHALRACGSSPARARWWCATGWRSALRGPRWCAATCWCWRRATGSRPMPVC